MNHGIATHLSALKEALHTLKDVGDDGFEGLLAAILSDICGQPFRLAASGSQHGRDGDTAFDGDSIYFEAKLYQKEVRKEAFYSKLSEIIAADKGGLDIWILCATSPISSQHAEHCKAVLGRVGIGCLIIDWQETALPLLAVLVASSPSTTEAFLTSHSQDSTKITGIRHHLNEIAGERQFTDFSALLRTELKQPSLGLALAKAANSRWLYSAFSNRQQARRYFGQPLAPLEATGLGLIDRSVLTKTLKPAFDENISETVFLIIGGEGSGKSWLAANAWIVSEHKPLFAVFTADELRMPRAMHDFEAVLIDRLTVQSSDTIEEITKTRWRRRLGSWRSNPTISQPRLVVFVDGLNQAPNFPWPRWIDATAKFLSEIGGHLIVTTNERHFAQRLRGNATARLIRVIVPEWNEDELTTILSNKGMSPDRLSADVFNFLRNPRILSIAVELLDAKDIERFEELTVGRLLFEHILRCERDGTTDMSAKSFAKALQGHADEILKRLSQDQHDDLNLFDVTLDERLSSVSSSRFFEDVPGDPDYYSIKNDGLPLALGLSLIGSLLKEHRNGRDPILRLSEIAEPVLAITETSEVVLSAIQAACHDPDCPLAVQTALIRYYASLQNLPDDHWPAFEALARRAPVAFLQAAENIALSGQHLVNMSWLTSALVAARGHETARDAIAQYATSWLAYYSLSSEHSMHLNPRHDPVDEVNAERAKRRAQIDEKWNNLSPAERTFVDERLKLNDDGSLTGLQYMAFQLLAGAKLARFGEALVNWAFSNALNHNIGAPDREFAQLISLNSLDWKETREALLKAAGPLTGADISTTGQWALVAVLRATGDVEDAARADVIVDDLTRDRPNFPGWRLIEEYCSADPCDPASDRPDNISGTASKFEKIDVSSLRRGLGYTSEDHFFEDALPGLARFEPGVALDTFRRYAANISERDGLPRRQGVFSLLAGSAALDPEIVSQLTTLVGDIQGSDPDCGEDERDRWVTTQYALFTVLPHKSGNEQLDDIVELSGRSLLLPMLEQLSSADEFSVERHLERVVQSEDVDGQVRVLSFAHFSGSPISETSRSRISDLLASSDNLVRGLALGISARLRDHSLLREIVSSGWTAQTLTEKADFFERWYGSLALLRAAEAGLIEPGDAVDRLAESHYGDAASKLGREGACAVAVRLDTALRTAAELNDIPEIPLVEQPLPSGSDPHPPLLSLVEESRATSMRDYVARSNETARQFEERQERTWQKFDRFRRELTVADARVLLDNISWRGFEAILSYEPTLAYSWRVALEKATDWSFKTLYFFAVGFARALAKSDGEAALLLIRRISREDPFVRHVIGPAKIRAESAMLWSIADVSEARAICIQRLNEAANDDDLATEVLAALSEGRRTVIEEYIDENIQTGIPSTIARALTVAGFLSSSHYAEELISRYVECPGLIGHAARNALYVYERDVWAQAWFERMKSARTSEDFWLNSILLTKIVDARYVVWSGDTSDASEIFHRFFPTILASIKRRLDRWRTKRKSVLFGQSAPDLIFFGKNK